MIRSLIYCQRLMSLEKRSAVRFLFNSQHPVFKQNTQLPADYDISDEHTHQQVVDKRTTDKILKENAGGKTYIGSIKCLKDAVISSCAYTEKEAIDLIEQNRKHWKLRLDILYKAIHFLNSKKLTSKSIFENPWLLGADPKYIESKVTLLNRLEPRDINDFAPLLKAPTIALYRVEKCIKRDKDRIPEGNLVYYFSKRLGIEPTVVCTHFAEHLFIFETDFEQIEENIDVMLKYGILPKHIITDLWAFRYDPKRAGPVFEACREAGRVNLKPWMIRCSPRVLEQMLKLSREKRDLLGENTIVDYLSARLEIENIKMRLIVDKIPAVTKIRVSKVKKVLDFLLIEENFHPEEIAANLRVLFNSLETTKKRVKELKHHGCRPSSLAYVCYSSKAYQNFLDKWIQNRMKLHNN